MAITQQTGGMHRLNAVQQVKPKKIKPQQLPQDNTTTPIPDGPGLTPEQLQAGARTDWINANHAGYLNQGNLATPGSNYDTWKQETGYGRVYDQAYDTARTQPGADPAMNFEAFVQGRPDLASEARFAYAHRPDNERQPNLYAGGGGHWSWWD